jgi:hypothetical protein
VAAPTQIEAQALPEPAAVQTAPAQWNLAQRIAFRFVFAYFLLYNLPTPGHSSLLGIIPGSSFVTGPYVRMWRAFVPWVATRVMHLSGPATVYPQVNGSGDSTLDYIQNLCFLVFAAAAALLWSALDRRRPNYQRLHYWLRVGVRYTLAATLFSYGFAKVFPLQFRPPFFTRLIEPYGDSSPMGILWTFMGASVAYTIFSGAAEVLGGLLLIPRRTVTLGALVSAGVLTNVVTLNFCYDVPVKLYSSNLLLMAIFLMAPDLDRLARVLVLHQPAPPGNLEGSRFAWRFGARTWRIAALALKTAFFGYLLYNHIHGGWNSYQSTRNAPKPPLYGLYEVESFTRNGVEMPPLLTDAQRWRKIAIQFPRAVSVKMMDDSLRGYTAEYDATKNSVKLTGPADAGLYTYAKPDDNHVLLTGDALKITLRRIDASKFLLVDRGFHWINERPFNR